MEAALAELGGLLTDLCAGGNEELSVLDSHLGRYWNGFHALKTRHKDETLTVAVLALAKSGEAVFPVGCGATRVPALPQLLRRYQPYPPCPQHAFASLLLLRVRHLRAGESCFLPIMISWGCAISTSQCLAARQCLGWAKGRTCLGVCA